MLHFHPILPSLAVGPTWVALSHAQTLVGWAVHYGLPVGGCGPSSHLPDCRQSRYCCQTVPSHLTALWRRPACPAECDKHKWVSSSTRVVRVNTGSLSGEWRTLCLPVQRLCAGKFCWWKFHWRHCSVESSNALSSECRKISPIRTDTGEVITKRLSLPFSEATALPSSSDQTIPWSSPWLEDTYVDRENTLT